MLVGWDCDGGGNGGDGAPLTPTPGRFSGRATTPRTGMYVIPCYTPQCKEADCIFCQSPKTNLCPKIRATQGKGVMPDGTSRFSTLDGRTIYHFMGCRWV